MSNSRILQFSTILLNWNRCNLLVKTIDSYLETISVPFELIIIDNNSTDNSKEIINKICLNNDNCRSIFLPDNIGGKAINLGLKLARAPLLHVSSNDLIYQPDWDKKVIKAFKFFSDLGQLAIVYKIPEKLKQKLVKISKNDITIYTTEGNVSTSSVFRREIWDRGISWGNFVHSTKSYQAPDDRKFSYDIQQAGYLVAWFSEPLARHNNGDIIENYDYYVKRFQAWGNLKSIEKAFENKGYKLKEADTDSGYKLVKLPRK